MDEFSEKLHPRQGPSSQLLSVNRGTAMLSTPPPLQEFSENSLKMGHAIVPVTWLRSNIEYYFPIFGEDFKHDDLMTGPGKGKPPETCKD